MSKQGTGKANRSAFDKSVLFEDHRPTETVPLPPYGVFSIRSLTRQQAIALGDIDGAAAIEAAIISDGVTAIDDEPVTLSRADVRRWQEAATGMALEPLSDAIGRLSGLHEKAERESVQRFPEGAGS